MTDYVLGFAFHEDQVLLIFKRHGPAPVIGKLNGIGGKVEPNETLLGAMVREFHEETGLSTPIESWIQRGVMVVPSYQASVYLFSQRFTEHRIPKQMTDERVSWQPVREINQLNVVPNLRWIVPMMQDLVITGIFITDNTPG